MVVEVTSASSFLWLEITGKCQLVSRDSGCCTSCRERRVRDGRGVLKGPLGTLNVLKGAFETSTMSRTRLSRQLAYAPIGDGETRLCGELAGQCRRLHLSNHRPCQSQQTGRANKTRAGHVTACGSAHLELGPSELALREYDPGQISNENSLIECAAVERDRPTVLLKVQPRVVQSAILNVKILCFREFQLKSNRLTINHFNSPRRDLFPGCVRHGYLEKCHIH